MLSCQHKALEYQKASTVFLQNLHILIVDIVVQEARREKKSIFQWLAGIRKDLLEVIEKQEIVGSYVP